MQEHPTDVRTSGDLTTIMGNVRLFGTMPNGQMLNLPQEDSFTDIEQLSFESMEGTNFVSENSQSINVDISDVPTGSGYIRISSGGETLRIDFRMVYCTTYRELRMLNPSIDFDPGRDDNEVYICYELRNYNSTNLELSIGNVLTIEIFNDGNLLYGYLSLVDTEESYVLGGNYKKEGGAVNSSGYFYTDNSLKYELHIECGS
ncbi:hypothetical protein N7E81_04325 [Reichenbachiella carrageenanivorans]|uniref:Uncharacterized protein n=1 Tax=Reichenbachiella carrageenanivorans TaxID=2979869 RepID=A0ABY6D2E1_9BACT|nr:hypothetical protein [Reichenbachiella carrageenanivorans]UXX80324.1 hypothetical protein N7E81_04325 [Reichenbachiella carrageenanivorans]